MRLLGVPTRVCFRPSSSSLLAAPQPRARPPKQRKQPESARELKSSQAIIRSYVPALIYRVPVPPTALTRPTCADLPRGRGVGSPRATAPHTRLELRPSHYLCTALGGLGKRAPSSTEARAPRAERV